MPFTLEGGVHGYVEVILSQVMYDTLALMILFITSTHLGILTLAQGSTQYEIAMLKTHHDESMQIFKDYQLINRALIQQALITIKAKCVSYLRNHVIGTITY